MSEITNNTFQYMQSKNLKTKVDFDTTTITTTTKGRKGFDVCVEDNKEFEVFSNKHYIVDIRIPHAF